MCYDDETEPRPVAGPIIGLALFAISAGIMIRLIYEVLT